MTTRTRPTTTEPTGDTAHDRFRPLTAADVREMTDAGSFERGRSYARTGQIFDGSLRGETLHASSYGSSGGPYRVEATLVPTDDPAPDFLVSDYLCTCPRGGFCKHVVALLLTWIEQPEVFAVRPPLAELLAGKSRDDLVALVELMVRHAPDLADLIELAPPAPLAPDVPAEPGTGTTRTVSLPAIRRQVVSAFSAMIEDGGWGWDPGAAIAAEIAPLREIGDRYSDAGRFADALVVYRAILEQGVAHWEETGDEGGELLAEIGWAAAGLARCLEVQAALPATDRLGPSDRADLLESLFEYWRFAGEYDQIGEAPDAAGVIAAHATEDERTTIAGWLRAELSGGGRGSAAFEAIGGGGQPVGTGPSGYVGYAGYAKRRAIHFLLDLKAAGGAGDEELLAEYQAAELWDDVAATLLRLGRVDEAIGLAARKLGPLDLTAFADRLLALDGDQVDRAFDLIEGWLWEKEGTNRVHEQHALAWLQDRYAAHGRPDRSLDAARRRFKAEPSVQTYQAVQTAATLPNQTDNAWEGLRPTLQAALRDAKAWGALVEIHLAEGNIADAIAALHREEAASARPAASGGFVWSGSWGLGTHRLRVAEAAAADYPDEAIRIYRLLAEAEIEQRQRSHYQTAAGHLARAKAVYLEHGRAGDWQVYIGELRETNKRLRALREELDVLGLN